MMNRTLRALYRTGLFVSALLTFGSQVRGQCDNTGNPYPAGAITLLGTGVETPIDGCSFEGEYSTLTGTTAGNQYTFTSESGYISVYQDGVTTTLLGFGASPLSVVAGTAGDMYAHWTLDASCTVVGDFNCYATAVTDNGATSACSGIPAPGNTLATLASACAGQYFTLSLQTPTTGSGVTYQWYDTNGPISGANASTLDTNQTVATDYYCEVTCDGNTTPSVLLSIPMNLTPAVPEDFESAVFPPGCWSETDPDDYILGAVASAYDVGTNSFAFNFYSAPGGDEFSFTSPPFAPVASGFQIAFDVAGAAYTGGEVDTVFLEESSNGGGTWTILQTMTNEDGVGTLSTVPASGPGYFPLGADWQPRAVTLTAGTDRIRFRAVSAFGNRVFMDNIVIEPLPTCDVPGGTSHVVLSTTTADFSWITTGALFYNVEVRTSGLPGSGAVGLEDAGAALPGPTFSATGLQPYTLHYAYVQADCGVDGLSDWSLAEVIFPGHCPAGTPDTFNEKITTFTLGAFTNPSGSTAGYEDFSGLTINAAPGVVYPLSVAITPAFTSDQILVWIDLNNDLDFDDVDELRFTSLLPLSNNPIPGTISVPNGTPAGNYRLRVRLHDSAGALPNPTPCGDSDYGQVEDYTINVCSAPVASVSVLDNCAGGTFDAQVDISSTGSGSPATITYSVSGGTSTTVNGIVGANPLGLSGTTDLNDYITVSVGNGSLCSLDLGDTFSNCADSLACGVNLPGNHCYKNNDTRTFHYVAEAGQTVTINFIQGSIDLADALNFYDGPDNLSPGLGGGNFSGDLSAADFNTTGRDLYFEINSDAANSCFDGGQAIPWQWEIQCTPDCTAPTGLAEYVLPISCNPQGFLLDVTVFTAGAAAAGGVDPLSTVDIAWSGPGVTAGSINDVLEGSTTQIGPFPLGSDVTVVLLHDGNTLCNTTLGTFTQANTCPPANDDCVNAQPLPVGAPGACISTLGTTAFATLDGPAPNCNNVAGTVQDVWYTLNTANYVNPIQVTFTAGTATNFAVELYTGCGGTFIPNCLPNSPLGINFTNFPANTVYYIRVFTNTGSGVAGTFSICVSGAVCTQPTTPTASLINHNSATVGWTGPIGSYVVEYGPAATFITPGTGATAGVGGTVVTTTGPPYTITGLAPSTLYRVAIRQNCGANGYSFNLIFTFTTTAAPPASTPITHAACGVGAAIPDLGCVNNTVLTATFNVTAPGTTLGTDVVLGSVDLILTHATRSHLRVFLISPNGQTRTLIQNRGGAGDDFGNNASCPTGAFRLVNGGLALGTIPAATNQITGSYAPEQSLLTYTGPASGTWTLRVCDATGTITGALQHVELNFLPCAPAIFTTTAVGACGTGQYNVNVNIIDMGSASAYSISNNLNGSTTSATGVGTWVAGPFTSGTPVTLTLNHNVDAACNAVTAPIVFYCPPANNECISATPLTPGTSCVFTPGTTLGATQSTAALACDGFTGTANDDVWYSFVATSAGHTITVDGDGTFDAVVQLLSGACNGTPVDCEDNTVGGAVESFTVYGLSIGETYYVKVYDYGTGVGGTFSICISQPPVNDLCAGAIAVTCNSVTAGTTAGSTTFDAPAACVDYASMTAGGVWYTLQGWGGNVTATTCSAIGFDSQLAAFSGSCGNFTCLDGSDDATCTFSGARSTVTFATTIGTTYYLYVTGFGTATGAFELTLTCGDVGAGACAANGLQIEIEGDANSAAQTTWQIIPQGVNTPVCSGPSSGPYIPGAVIPEYCCLPNGCYRFVVLDGAGDGIANGGYQLLTQGTLQRIIDNRDNFSNGGTSAISTTIDGGRFCLPIGTDKLTYPTCDKLTWVNNQYVVASANPAVSSEWIVGGANNVQDANSGYEFWIFDPNGSYSFRRFRSHNVTDGFSPANANRACHMKLNGWSNTGVTPHVPANVLMNVRVRGRVNGANFEFGPACQLKIDAVAASCPQTSLQDDIANADYSCVPVTGVNRNFGGSSSPLNRIFAKPPQFVPAVSGSLVRYQFRFRIPAEDICIVRPPQTSAQMTLNWSAASGPQLVCGRQYEVEVRVSKTSGTTWCVDAPSPSCSPITPWGKVCLLNINPCLGATPGPQSMAMQADADLELYPNPNQGEQLFVALNAVEVGVETVTIDMYDMTGKRVSARTIAVQDGFVNTMIDLEGDLSGGVYMVNITAGTKTYTERLVIQP